MACEVRILDFNFAFQSETDITATSEDVNFPASNLRQFNRSKTWRSSGTFIIDSTNSSLDFDIGGGEITATLTTGTYTPTTLATEIATQMNVVSTDTHTATYDGTTGKWTIDSDGGTFSLLTNTGSNTATSVFTSIGFDTAADKTGAATYTGENVAIHTEENVVFDLKTTEDIDAFSFILDPLDGNKFTSSVVIKLQANATDVWTSPAVDETITLDSRYDIALKVFSTAQSYRYWRVQITDPSNPNLYVEIPKIFLSDSTLLSQNPEIGWKFLFTDRSKIITTEFGHEYADVFPQLRGFEFDFAVMDNTAVVTLEDIFRSVGSVTPVLFSLDSTGGLYDAEQFLLYSKFDAEFGSEHVNVTLFNKQLKLREVL